MALAADTSTRPPIRANSDGEITATSPNLNEEMNTLRQHFIEQERKKEEATHKLIGWCIAPFLAAWVFVWYNYVLVQWPLGYWKWFCFAVVMWLIPRWVRKPVLGITFTVTLLAQIANWLGLVTLPLIKP